MDEGQVGATLGTEEPADVAPTPPAPPSVGDDLDVHALDGSDPEAARRAAKRERKAARRTADAASKAAAKAAKRAGKAGRKAAKAGRKAAKAAKAARIASTHVDQPGDGDPDAVSATWVPVPVDTSGSVASKAGGVLEEVADLVRQAAQPAAARIVERVGWRPDAEAGAAPDAMPASSERVPAETAPGAVIEAPALAADSNELTPVAEAIESAAGVSTTAIEPAGEPAGVDAEPSPPEAAPASPEAATAPPEAAPAPPEAAPASPAPPEARSEVPAHIARPAPPDQATGAAPAGRVPGPVGSSPVPEITVAPGAVIGAAIDIGANSAHLLVAAAGGHQVQPLLDTSVFLGLGDRVAEHGLIGALAREELVHALVDYAATARRLGARDLTIVGTEPLRRAADAAALVAAVERAAGVPLYVLGHEEEAMLTLLGVTMGRPIRSEILVVDIGGGSSELVQAGPHGVVRALGISLGSARLTRDLVHADPPSLAEIEALRVAARAAIAEAPDASPAEMVAVGGTASNLLRLMPSTSLDRVLTRRRIAVALAMLTVQRSDQAAERHLLRPQRARILPAGAVIVDAILERYRIDRLRVVDEGIREGAVLAAAAAGSGWRDRLPTLVRGWLAEGPRPD
jgi:Ppx/GppA phosphatase family